MSNWVLYFSKIPFKILFWTQFWTKNINDKDVNVFLIFVPINYLSKLFQLNTIFKLINKFDFNKIFYICPSGKITFLNPLSLDKIIL